MKTSIDAAREARKPTESSRLAKAAAVATTTLATLASAAVSAGQPQGQMASDLATRDRGIHWPPGFEPEKADLFAHNAQLRPASLARDVAHGNCDGLLLSDDHDQLLPPCNTGAAERRSGRTSRVDDSGCGFIRTVALR
jgi:hypothetical protein